MLPHVAHDLPHPPDRWHARLSKTQRIVLRTLYAYPDPGLSGAEVRHLVAQASPHAERAAVDHALTRLVGLGFAEWVLAGRWRRYRLTPDGRTMALRTKPPLEPRP